MKQGFDRGYNAGCCDGLEIWGVASEMPDISYSPISTYGHNRGSYVLHVDAESLGEASPTLWPRSHGQGWAFHAAKVPGTYPPPPDQLANHPSSSKATGEWSVEIGIAGIHYHDEFLADEGYTIKIDEYDDVQLCSGSRAIYVDGQQELICYHTVRIGRVNPYVQLPNHYTHTHIPVGDPSNSVEKKANTWNGAVYFDYVTGTHSYEDSSAMGSNLMEALSTPFKGYIFHDLIGGSPNESNIKQPPCGNISYGKDYYLISSYNPDKIDYFEGTLTPWTVARIKYEGTGSSMGVFSTYTNKASGLYLGTVGDTSRSYAGNYWIVLPSTRVYLDSSVSGSDECWVCAINKNSSHAQQIVTGQWLSDVYSPGDSSPSTGFADGTLANNDIDFDNNVILNTSSNDYPDELWQNIAIRSYNRVYDPATGRSKDLLLFTSRDDSVGGLVEANNVKATFEGGDLNAGLAEAEIEFETGGIKSTDAWVSRGNDPDTGSYSARVEAQDVTAQNNIFLKLKFTKTRDGYITFNVQHSNRLMDFRFTPSGTLSTLPDIENYLDIRMDGSLVSGDNLVGKDGDEVQFQVDNGSGFVPVSTSRFDNITAPEDANNDVANFDKYRPCRIYVRAGTHTITFNQRRKNQESTSQMTSQLDELFLDDLLVGDDPTGKKSWLYNGQKVQKVEWFAWPQRDSDVVTFFADRVSTNPDFVTFDKQGRILLGNPHYVVRLKSDPDDSTMFILDEDFGQEGTDGGGGGGYLRFTASPTQTHEFESAPTCDQPDPTFTTKDVIDDPPWGSFQILPVGSAGDFQLRGVNGTLRDATEQPFLPEDFAYPLPGGGEGEEIFRELLGSQANSGRQGWYCRAHSWTVTNNGKTLRPHVEVMWRPTKYIEAWPEGPWPYKPYRSDFEEHHRPRNPLLTMPGDVQPRWSMSNYIVAASYCDTRSHFPQSVWRRETLGDPPVDPDNPNFPGDDPDEGAYYPSADWYLTQSFGYPTSNFRLEYQGTDHDVCDGMLDDVPFTQRAKIYAMNFFDRRSYTDFDAVDVQCVCCE